MYYFEKDYIMRLIHGIARAIARILFDRELEENEEIAVILEKTGRAKYDYLRKLVDDGDINTAEEKLFDLLETVTWDSRQKAALVLAFYDHVNTKDDLFLAQADFSREEIIEGLEDAMKTAGLEIPEYLRI